MKEIAAGHLASRDRSDGTVARDPRGRLRHAAERCHRPFSAMLLGEPDDRVEDDHCGDHQRVLEVADRGHDQTCDDQYDDHRIGELRRKQTPRRLGGRFQELVVAVRRHSGGRFRTRQTDDRIGPQPHRDRVGLVSPPDSGGRKSAPQDGGRERRGHRAGHQRISGQIVHSKMARPWCQVGARTWALWPIRTAARRTDLTRKVLGDGPNGTDLPSSPPLPSRRYR